MNRAIDVGPRICAIDQDGVLVVPLSCDYAIWSEQAAGRVEEFRRLAESQSDVKGIALWVDGKLSERSQRELESRHIAFAEDILAKR